MTTKENYIAHLGTLVKAGIPLIVTKTREPYKAIEAIENYVQIHNKKLVEQKLDGQEVVDIAYSFGRWTMLDGWLVKDPADFAWDFDNVAPPVEKKGNNMINPEIALKTLLGMVDKSMGDEPLPPGIYVMNWLHPAIDVPVIKAALLELANQFIYEDKRLILIVPEVVEIPHELQDFVCFLDYNVPSDAERKSDIIEIFEAYQLPTENQNLDLISSAGAGMTGFEFANSVARSIRNLAKTGKSVTSDEIAKTVLVNKTEMVKRSEVLEIMPSGSMSDIGGLDNLKEWIQETACCFTKEAQEFGVDKPKGVALFGPPGTGKSASAKAIGSALGLPVIRFDVSRVFNSLVGSSEARVQSALKMIAAMAPCVAFIDEIDKAFDINRGGGDSGVGQRVLGSILTFLQEEDAPVFWVMTGNRTDGLPPELLRKGRLDEVFSVTVPNEEERLEIIKIHLRKRKQDPVNISDLSVAVDVSNGYVAAELEAAVKEAIKAAYNRSIPVTGQLIGEQLRHMRPLSESFAREFASMQTWAEQNARPASKPSATQVKDKNLQKSAKIPSTGSTKQVDGIILKRQRRVATDMQPEQE